MGAFSYLWRLLGYVKKLLHLRHLRVMIFITNFSNLYSYIPSKGGRFFEKKRKIHGQSAKYE